MARKSLISITRSNFDYFLLFVLQFYLSLVKALAEERSASFDNSSNTQNITSYVVEELRPLSKPLLLLLLYLPALPPTQSHSTLLAWLTESPGTWELHTERVVESRGAKKISLQKPTWEVELCVHRQITHCEIQPTLICWKISQPKQDWNSFQI